MEYLGEVDDAGKNEILGNAAARLFPIDWPEPFGMVMIEAMACGTPVLAFDKGSVREVIDDGVTGFIVDDIESGIAAIPRLLALDRTRVRRQFDERFSSTSMAKAYATLYARVFASSSHLRRNIEKPAGAIEALMN